MTIATCASFDRDLAQSQRKSSSPVWLALYRHFFGASVSHIEAHNDHGWHQQAGIDREVHVRTGTTLGPDSHSIWVEEKTDYWDTGNVAVEEWSNIERGFPGWITKPILADYLLYAMPAINQEWLFDFPILQMAWKRFSGQWRELAIARKNGFKEFSRQSGQGHDLWHATGLIIPPRELHAAMYQCSHVRTIDLSDLLK